MKCEIAREHFSGLVEGDIDQAIKLALDGHFAACSACSEEYSSFKQTWMLLDDIPTVEAPAYLRHHVLQKIQNQVYESDVAAGRSLLERLKDFFVLPGLTRRLAWSSAAICGVVLVGVGVVSFPGSNVANVLQMAIFGGNGSVHKSGLAAIEVNPIWQNGKWTVEVTGAQELTMLRIYQSSVLEDKSNWSTKVLATEAPTAGLAKPTNTIDFNGSYSFTPQLSNDIPVNLIIVHISSGGLRRDMVVYLPMMSGSGTTSNHAGPDILSNYLWRLADEYQVAIVADAGQDTGIGNFVLPTHRSGARNVLGDIAQQANMKMDVDSTAGTNVYRFTGR